MAAGHGRPTTAELVAAVAEFLETDVRESTTGQVNFHSRVAVNALRMVERELLADSNDGVAAALAGVGHGDEAQLAAAIRAGDLDGQQPAGAIGVACAGRPPPGRRPPRIPGRIGRRPMPAPDTVVNAADQLFAAIERGDKATLQQMFDDGIAVWRVGSHRDDEKARALRVVHWFIDVTEQRSYEILDRQLFSDGFVQQHILHATGQNGAIDRPARVHRD